MGRNLAGRTADGAVVTVVVAVPVEAVAAMAKKTGAVHSPYNHGHKDSWGGGFPDRHLRKGFLCSRDFHRDSQSNR